MKDIVLFMLPRCPHCHLAIKFQDELLAEHPEWKQATIITVDEERDTPPPGDYNYYYVPTYYVDGVKIHEGHAEREDVERVFLAAMGD